MKARGPNTSAPAYEEEASVTDVVIVVVVVVAVAVVEVVVTGSWLMGVAEPATIFILLSSSP